MIFASLVLSHIINDNLLNIIFACTVFAEDVKVQLAS